MQLYYYRDREGNFGDDLNQQVWNHFLPELLDDDPSTLLIGIGTLLGHPFPAPARKIVFGSGAGYGQLVELDDTWDIRCVRGPLTARALGLDPRLAITDPAILLSAMPAFTAPVQPCHEVSFMPHHGSKRKGDWAAICAAAGVNYLDPAHDVATLVHAIRGSRLVVAEAMHAAIVADAFRVPWIPVICYDHILSFKWEDWCRSLDLSYRPTYLPPIYDLPPRLPAGTRLKSEAKRALARLKLAPARWNPPLPRRTTRSDAARDRRTGRAPSKSRRVARTGAAAAHGGAGAVEARVAARSAGRPVRFPAGRAAPAGRDLIRG